MIHRKKRGTLKPHHSSIVLNLKPVLGARNIIHPTAFLIKIGINSATASKMLRGDAVQVNFRQLSTLCINLNCTPNDLFALRDLPLPENHALNKIPPLTDTAVNINEWLATKTMEEVQELLKK
jgi:DNA-binding Xre family transcriptional regulator